MNEKRRKGWLKHLDFVIVDIVCIQLAYLLAYSVREPNLYVYRGVSLYTHLNIVLLVVDICYVLIRPVYKNIIKRSIFHELGSVLVHNIIMWLVVMAYLYLTKQAFWFSRSMMSIAIVLCVIFMMAGRVVWKAIVRTVVRKGKHQANTLIISDEENAAKMIRRFRNRMYNGFNLAGFVIAGRDMEGGTIERVPVVCNLDHLLDYIKEKAVDEVMINLPGNKRENRELAYRLLEMGVVVHLTMDYHEDEFPNAAMERIGGYTVLTASINTAGSLPLTVKRLTDIAAGLVGCVIMGIAFLFVAPAIYKASPGPIFFKQERMGKNGRRFWMYKFRSMYLDAEERKKELMAQNKMDGLMFKMDNDPRIIGSEKGPGKGIGNLIRRLSIDELPQFINILKGDMSLVGTRPPTAAEFEAYDYHHKIRLSMKPGLTGMWQVSGRSDITDFEEIVRLDAYYIENWSLALDVKIILKTFAVVLKKEGAE